MNTADQALRFACQAHVAHTPSAGRPRGTLIMLHGLGADITQFDPILHRMDAADHDIVRVDLRSHGRTPDIGGDTDLTFQQLGMDLAALLNQRSFTPPLTGVGISMGAGALAAAALRDTGLLSSLLLIRPAWLDQPNPPNLAPFQQIAALLRDLAPAQAEAAFRTSPTFQNIQAASAYAADSLISQFHTPDAARRRARLSKMPASTPVRALSELEDLRIPTLVVGTTDDPIHPLTIAHQWSRHVPGARHTTVSPKSLDDDHYERQLAGIIQALPDLRP